LVLIALTLVLVAAGSFAFCAGAAQGASLKVGVLKFGTVNWELNVVKRHGLDQSEGVALEVLGLASKNATSVALQAGGVDIIVTDWVWVSRQRAEGARYAFVPFSAAAGAVVVPANSPASGLRDLKGKRLGIAGGPLDKNWLLLQAFAKQELGFDAAKEMEVVFAAPPLLNEQLLAGRLDAVLNFWHFTARLEAAGLRRLIEVTDVTRSLGIETRVPLIGYVFDERWAEENREALLGFFRASREAKRILKTSDEEWELLKPLMKVEDEATFRTLRERYRAGIPETWGGDEHAAAARLFDVLAHQGGEKLVGRAATLQDGTFWPHVEY
jgi:NitT/TauT family transport system substrate-binding protein